MKINLDILNNYKIKDKAPTDMKWFNKDLDTIDDVYLQHIRLFIVKKLYREPKLLILLYPYLTSVEKEFKNRFMTRELISVKKLEFNSASTLRWNKMIRELQYV